ncbi:MAG: hypothetical protein AAGI51_06325 [Pseudomonadota bacterium]
MTEGAGDDRDGPREGGRKEGDEDVLASIRRIVGEDGAAGAPAAAAPGALRPGGDPAPRRDGVLPLERSMRVEPGAPPGGEAGAESEAESGSGDDAPLLLSREMRVVTGTPSDAAPALDAPETGGDVADAAPTIRAEAPAPPSEAAADAAPDPAPPLAETQDRETPPRSETQLRSEAPLRSATPPAAAAPPLESPAAPAPEPGPEPTPEPSPQVPAAGFGASIPGGPPPLRPTPAAAAEPPSSEPPAAGDPPPSGRELRRAMATDPGARGAPRASSREGEPLEAMVRRILREELSGEMGERVSRNIKLLVEREVRRAIEQLAAEAERGEPPSQG